MARRRSLNRRWSRKSLNATELDQDSEFFDEDNPVWWQNLTDASTLRPSAQTSFAETTLPNLTPDSLVNDSELHDRWWDNLDRTSLQSSRRFSTRKSVNPGEVAPESFVSEGDDDVSIKKRKILLRARAKRSVGTENFLKAFDDSDVAHSEPVPSKKRKTQSPAKSEADLMQRKSRTRHSRSLAERRDSSLNTSNDTDIVIKARPKAFKKRATQVSSAVYDEILTDAGPSGINTSKNASRINTPEKTIDSNESGFMGPPITGSHRKRLSTISKKLDMNSDESDGNAGTIKSRNDFQLKSKDNASFNPFDEILSGQLNESTASADAANKSSRSSNAATRMSKSLRQNPLLQVPITEDEEKETKEASGSESQLRETLNDEEKDHRSSSALKEDSRVSKSRRNEEDGNEGTMDEWNVPETQEDPSEAVKIKKNSTMMIEESVIDENSPESQNRDRRSSSVIKENARHSKRRTRDATSELNVPETQEDANLSTKRIERSRMIEESPEIDTQSQERDRRSSVLKKHSGDSRRHTKDATSEWNVPETQEDTRRIKNSTMIEESAEIDKESQDRDRRSSVLKKHTGDSRRHTKDRTSEWNVPETQEQSRKSTRSATNSVMIEESIEIDQLPESQDRRSSSVLKKHSGDSRRHTKDRTSEWNVPETQEQSRKSTRSTTNSLMIEESIEIDQLTESHDHRSSSVLKKHSAASLRRTGDATIEKTATSEWEVQEAQENLKKSTVVEESADIDKLPESQKVERRSSGLKRNSRLSQRNTRDKTIEEVPETQEGSRISIRSTKNSTIIGGSMEIDTLRESQGMDRRSSSVLKDNSRVSKRRTRDATIEEWELPETQEDSRISIRPVKNSTMIEESMEIDKLPETHDRDRRSSSVSKKGLRVSKRRTREATIDEATIEDDELPSFDEKSAKFTSTLKQNVREPKRRTKSMAPKVRTPEHEKLAEKWRSQLFEDWETSASEEEEDKAIKSHDSHNSSLITKTLAVSINRLSPPTNSHSRNAKEFKETTEESEEEKKSPIKRRSVRSRSRNLVDSAYELPDKDRTVSPVISTSEDEAINKNSSPNTSRRKSSKNRQEDNRSARQSVNRSISDTSRRNRANANVSLSRVDPAADLGESDSKFGPEKSTKSREHLFAENKTMSTKGTANASNSQQEDSDQSVSEELAIGSQRSNLNLSRKRSSAQRKADDSEAAESRQDSQFAESSNEEEAHQSHKPNCTSPRKSSRLEKQIEPTKNTEPASQRNPSFAESISEAETEIADNEPSETNLKSLRTEKRSDKSRKSSMRPNVSGKREESGESISEEEFNSKSLKQSAKDKSRASRKISGRLNVSGRRVESDESISEKESNLKALNQSLKDENFAGRKSANNQNVSKQHTETHESGTEEGAQDLENMEPPVDESANEGRPVDKLVRLDAKNRNKSSFPNVDNIEEDTSTSMPSETIPLAPDLTIPPRNINSFLSNSNRPRAQKNITDFFPSKFLQRTDSSKMLDTSASFDKEKLDLMKKELEAKRQQMRSLRIEESSKKEEIVKSRPPNATKATKLRAKENAPKEPAKPPKVVDKAYIVNGQVYKRPKLPRPKPWVTDRLYRHLWKRLEPKYNLKTRIKSERFVEQLAEVVALTIRRKKYDSYKLEVDALMKEMARLNIVKTRNDFYDFCYDFLPYDFRVKVTPMVLPGNIRNIPYDPATLHTPILSES